MGPLGIMNQMGAVTGVVFAYSLAFVAPYSEEEEAKTTRSWRVLFIFPGIMSAIQMLLMIFVFRYDTPKYYKMKEKMNRHDKVMNKIYKDYEKENIQHNQNNEVLNSEANLDQEENIQNIPNNDKQGNEEVVNQNSSIENSSNVSESEK
jgi:sugar phosphate permease